MDASTTGTPNNSYQKQNLALRVALDTMKDRCILQQKRLSEVEEENQKLRERFIQSNKSSGNTQHNAGGVAENFQLRLQVSELQRQNVQLNAHINMVSAENRKLWQRLSQMAKEQSTPVSDTTLTNFSSGGVVGGEGASPNRIIPTNISTNQNLIRSKTFTQHSPNPNLRHKLLPTENCESNELLDGSLEADVAIEAFSGSGEKQFYVNNNFSESQTDLGFGYLNVDDTSSNISPQEHDFNLEARKCIEGLQEMRREAVKQQHDLNTVFALLESRIALQPCPECIKKSHKPEMADKSLETDESFNDAIKYDSNTTNGLNTSSVGSVAKVLPALQNSHLNIIQEKILADERNNICPMCGNIYDSQVSFESFCEHVEEHFRDENIQDTDHNMEHNFEFISHAVGDF